MVLPEIWEQFTLRGKPGTYEDKSEKDKNLFVVTTKVSWYAQRQKEIIFELPFEMLCWCQEYILVDDSTCAPESVIVIRNQNLFDMK